ncbi:GNAT family N-acetyltransferase [Occultella gossypii]|uniref:GNAT family N-acetyltransferase n=1 Tax=Occultella gossypii TaxID=2800820 RepID=A0ABS7SAL9_9MICO|nr:GNAT family N-acetyltransferase [Occultella gossypii]MBZ2197387.1 GNAT family N-acetyltransferase [Occultella gossypii]
MSGFKVRAVRKGDWSALEELFGRAGASNGCWCQYWLLGPEYHRRDRQLNRAALARQVRREHSPGLLAYSDGAAVGWARFTPRSQLRYVLDRFKGYDFPDDDARVLSCFFTARASRGQGVMSALIEHAVTQGNEHGYAVEGYPIDPSAPGATRNRFPGVLPAFLEHGFFEVGRLAADRAVVRTKS